MPLAEVEAASRGNSSGQIIDTRNQYYSCSGSLGVQCLFATRRGKREEAAGVGSSVSEDLTCSLLHNRHPVTFSSTATLDIEAKNKPLSALVFESGARGPSRGAGSTIETLSQYRNPPAAFHPSPTACVCRCERASLPALHMQPPRTHRLHWHEPTITPADDGGVVAAIK